MNGIRSLSIVKQELAEYGPQLDPHDPKQLYLKGCFLELKNILPDNEEELTPILWGQIIKVGATAQKLIFGEFERESRVNSFAVEVGEEALATRAKVLSAINDDHVEILQSICRGGGLRQLSLDETGELFRWALKTKDFVVLHHMIGTLYLNASNVDLIIDLAHESHQIGEVAENIVLHDFDRISEKQRDKLLSHLETTVSENEIDYSRVTYDHIKCDYNDRSVEEKRAFFLSIVEYVREGALRKIHESLENQIMRDLDAQNIYAIFAVALNRGPNDSLQLLLRHDSFNDCDRSFFLQVITDLICRGKVEKAQILMNTSGFKRLPLPCQRDIENKLRVEGVQK